MVRFSGILRTFRQTHGFWGGGTASSTRPEGQAFGPGFISPEENTFQSTARGPEKSLGVFGGWAHALGVDQNPYSQPFFSKSVKLFAFRHHRRPQRPALMRAMQRPRSPSV